VFKNPHAVRVCCVGARRHVERPAYAGTKRNGRVTRNEGERDSEISNARESEPCGGGFAQPPGKSVRVCPGVPASEVSRRQIVQRYAV